MNKKIGVIILFLITLSPLLQAVEIPGTGIDLEEGMNQIIEQVIGFGTPVFEKIIGEYSTSEFFFSKILLLILLVIIIKKVLEKTPIGDDNKNVSFIISLIISILGIRFISQNEFFEAIFIQYGVLGIAITTILPLVIFFYFVHNTKVGTFGRKMFWGIYTIILAAIWISKSGEIPEVANWIYGLSLVATTIFLIMDKSIHSYLGLSGFKKFEKDSNKKRIREAKKEMDILEEHFRHRRVSFSDYKKEKKAIEDYIKELSKE